MYINYQLKLQSGRDAGLGVLLCMREIGARILCVNHRLGRVLSFSQVVGIETRRLGDSQSWVAGPCLFCVILLETVDGVHTVRCKCTQENGG